MHLPPFLHATAGRVLAVGRAAGMRALALGLGLLLAGVAPAGAQVPLLLGHQGRIIVDGALFEGPGRFKFALVDATAAQRFWGNAADGNADGQPDAAVTLPVSRGLYSVALGDVSLANMAPLTPAALALGPVYLRVWFDDGVRGFQWLDPDHRITAVGYALVASTVPDGSLPASKLASGVLSFTNLTGVLGPTQVPPGFPVVSDLDADPQLVAAGYRRFLTIPGPPWATGTAIDPPSVRSGHAGVWTGERFLVWGGSLAAGQYLNTGGAYDPVADRWAMLPTATAPGARTGHVTVWTGQEMIVWGGEDAGLDLPATGGRYDPVRAQWKLLSNDGAPGGRVGAVAVWTRGRLVLWGGRDDFGILATGGVYDPESDRWTSLALPNPPAARFGAVGVWTGSQWLIWGGRAPAGPLASGARLTFSSGVPVAWSPLATAEAPSARTEHAAVWTGTRMLVWGGKGTGDDPYLGDGASYDPEADTWTPLPTEGAPSPRAGHAAVWTCSELLILGGENASGLLATGSAYDPGTGRWRALTTAGNPNPRRGAAAVWTGREVLVFGGQGPGGAVGALQRLDLQPTTHFYRKP